MSTRPSLLCSLHYPNPSAAAAPPLQRYPHMYLPKRSTDSSTGTNHIERMENVIPLYVALKGEGVWVSHWILRRPSSRKNDVSMVDRAGAGAKGVEVEGGRVGRREGGYKGPGERKPAATLHRCRCQQRSETQSWGSNVQRSSSSLTRIIINAIDGNLMRFCI